MRWIFRIASALLVFALLAVGAFFLIPQEKIAQLAVAEFNKITGRQLTLTGSVRPTLWPQLGVRTGPVTLANADWSNEGPMLAADGLSISIDTQTLFGGAVRITGVELINPVILLERNSDGLGNWVFTLPSGATAAQQGADLPTAGTPFSLDRAEIKGGKLTFIDHATGNRLRLDAIDAVASLPALDGPADLALTASLSGEPVRLNGRIAEFGPFVEGRLSTVSMAGQAGAATVGFEGRLGADPLMAEGQLAADLADLTAVSALAGISAPDLPDGLGAQQVAINGTLTVTEAGSVHLRGGTITLDGNTLKGDADFTPGADRPKIAAQITAGALNLASVPKTGGGQDGGMKADGWPAETLDVSGLGAMDAEIALSADSIDLGMAKFGTTRVLVTIDRARAVFDIREIAAYEGTIAGQFVVNGRKGLSVGGDLAFSNLAIEPLLTELAGYDRLIGTGDVRFKFLGVGNSVNAIMQGLSGSGSVALGRGEIRGFDVAGMLRTLDAGYVGEGQKTVFDSLAGRFVIDGGVLSNDDLALAAPVVTATGSGQIGIGARTLDYRLRPTALAAADGSGGIMVPLLITGTWANPKFRLDLESLARERLEEEAKALEAKAKARAQELEAEAKAQLEEKAREELGLELLEGEDLEAAARRRAQEALEEEATRALEQLLGGGEAPVAGE